jgi:hypothetical protein
MHLKVPRTRWSVFAAAIGTVLAVAGAGPVPAAASGPALPAAKQARLNLEALDRAAALRSVPAAPKPIGAGSTAQAAPVGPVVQAASSPPPYTYSRYVGKYNGTFDLYTMGCNQGHASDRQGQPTQVALLNFGDPGYVNGAYGAWDNGLGGFVRIGSVSQGNTIEWMVSRYMQGFWNCTVAGSRSFMNVAPGTNNHGSGPVNYAHGQAWGRMVQDLNRWITSSGFTAQLWAHAGADIETSWSTPAAAENWANGFNSIGGVGYYDDGDAAGCPANGSGACNPYNYGNNLGWTTSDEYKVAWGIPAAFAVPEIYGNDPSVNSDPPQANEWEQISLWGASHGGAIFFSVALSQYQACIDAGFNCSGDFNTPAQSWQQMENQLNSHSVTAQTIPFSSEMSYQTS